jgi:2-succinyl-6-hydroxy-2,4-cyclohexadiene-1-carboxylate synthase
MNFLALHGFTQRGSMWDEVAALAGGDWSAPDLPGHGGRPACSWEEAVALVGGLLEGVAPPRCLVGYSMGGRLALAAALDHPSPVDRLVVFSASAGIEEGADRQRRRAEDLALADRLEAMGVGAFVDEWLSRPLFAGLAARPPAWRADDRQARAGNDASGLAAALRLLGQGAQPYLGDRLGELGLPVLLVAGGEDRRYADLAGRLGERIARATVAEVAGAGHAVVGERPAEVAARLAAWAASG